MEEQTPKSDDAFVTYPLGTLHRTLEVMNCALDMLEIQRAEEHQRESFKARIAQLETRYHRHELLRDGKF
ncbi:hypothetical protein PsorP6_006522 [Peronosclerospora sorghi]|uniref:Uncharacterized protein n=1 Tax=Peronosclerospora sorghi TaxID=230839 RepID=A0ACC0W6Q9_9STRA|nr:hypothetical protein PsorP6_006522 [Peronosclerospora sorghi]